MMRRMRSTMLPGAVALTVIALGVATESAQEASAVTPKTTIKLFDGSSLANFEGWLIGHHSSDPQRVCSVVDQIDGAPAIRISGET